MHPLLFDLIIVALVLLSLALGFMRGFCNEVFTIFGWIAAVLATLYFTPVLKPYGEQLIDKKWLASLLTASAIFLVTLGVFSVVSHYATRTLQKSKLGIIDRSLGFGFGILRAIVLLGLGFLLFSFVFAPDQRPEFVQEARTRPFLEASAHWVQAIIPGLSDIKLKEDDKDPLDKVIKPKDVEKGKDTEHVLEDPKEKDDASDTE